MSQTLSPPQNLDAAKPVRGEPTWHVVERFPSQGDWSVEEYFAEFGGTRGYEYVDGVVEKLPVATREHQRIAG